MLQEMLLLEWCDRQRPRVALWPLLFAKQNYFKLAFSQSKSRRIGFLLVELCIFARPTTHKLAYLFVQLLLQCNTLLSMPVSR